MPTDWLKRALEFVADQFPPGHWLNQSFNVRAVVVVLLVSVICGAVGALVVGNRMSFFSDALAHCAFAGVTLGMLISLSVRSSALETSLVPIVTVSFGILVGLAIAFVREKTGLASDTVIGVFFAGAVGFGGMLFGALSRSNLSPESFLFGNILYVYESDILWLVGLSALLTVVLFRRYNHFVLTSFNPSLARSRGVPLRWCNYLFIILLALIVNLCLRAVGALLINALLVVPAATAANMSRNLRQMFWGSVGLSMACGICGLWVSNTVHISNGRGEELALGPSGTTVVLTVVAFFLTVAWRAWSDRRPGATASLAAAGAPPENAGSPAEPAPPRPA